MSQKRESVWSISRTIRGVRSRKRRAAAPRDDVAVRPVVREPDPSQHAPGRQRGAGGESPSGIAPLQDHDVEQIAALLQLRQYPRQGGVEYGVILEYSHHFGAALHQIPHCGPLAQGVGERPVRNGIEPQPPPGRVVHQGAVLIGKGTGVHRGPHLVLDAGAGELRRHPLAARPRALEIDENHSHRMVRSYAPSKKKRFVAADGPVDAEGRRPLPKRVARMRGAVQGAAHRLRQRPRVADRHELAPPSTLQDLVRPEPAIGADDRAAAGHRFDQDGRQPLMPRRENEHPRLRHERIRVFHEPGEVHVLGNPKRFGLGPQLRLQTALAQHDQPRRAVGEQPGERGEQGREILLPGHPARGEDDLRAGFVEPGMAGRLAGVGGKARGHHGIIDGMDPVGRNAHHFRQLGSDPTGNPDRRVNPRIGTPCPGEPPPGPHRIVQRTHDPRPVAGHAGRHRRRGHRRDQHGEKRIRTLPIEVRRDRGRPSRQSVAREQR